MLNIAVCDDDKIFADSLSKLVKTRFQDADINCNVKTFYDAQDFYSVVKEKYFDLLILDIEIGSESGIVLADKIRYELGNNKSLIVYVSSHSRYHDSGQLYGTAPIHYISKPVKLGEIEKVVDIVSRKVITQSSPDDYFTYSFKTDKHLLLKRDIYYFECNRRNIVAVTKESRVSFISTMGEVRKQAFEPYYVPIHRSFLINVHHLENYNGQHAVMKNGDRLPISDRQRKEAVWAIADFFSKNAKGNNHD